MQGHFAAQLIRRKVSHDGNGKGFRDEKGSMGWCVYIPWEMHTFRSEIPPRALCLGAGACCMQFLIEYDNILFSGIAKVEVQPPNLVTERAGDIANERRTLRQSVFLRQFLHMGLLFESVLLSARWSARSCGFITW